MSVFIIYLSNIQILYVKGLVTYISGTLITDYINESKRLSDLKGKKISSIEVGGVLSGTLKWDKRDVEIQDPGKLTDGDIMEIYDRLKSMRNGQFISVFIEEKLGGPTALWEYRLIKDKEEILVSIHRNDKVVSRDIIDNDPKAFVQWVYRNLTL